MNETLINIGTDFENLEDKELLIKDKAVFMKEAFVTKNRIFTACKNDITTIFILRQSGTLHIPLNQQPRNAYALRGLISLIICCFILLYTDLNYQQQRINGFLFPRLPCVLL